MKRLPDMLKDTRILAGLILKRSYSKNEDINVLKENGYSDEKAISYMDGYVDGLSYVLSCIYPNMDFEEYIKNVIDNPIRNINIESIKPGMILVAKTCADTFNNLDLILSVQKINDGVSVTLARLISEFTFNEYIFERKYNIEISGLPSNYSEKFAIDLGTMYPIIMIQSDILDIRSKFSIIHQISEDEVNKIIKAYEAYDKEMGELYDIAMNKNK